MIQKDLLIAKFDKPNQNGRIYTKECFTPCTVPVYLDTERNVRNIAGMASIVVREDGVYANVKTVYTMAGDVLARFLNQSTQFCSLGMGRVDSDNVVYDYRLDGLCPDFGL